MNENFFDTLKNKKIFLFLKKRFNLICYIIIALAILFFAVSLITFIPANARVQAEIDYVNSEITKVDSENEKLSAELNSDDSDMYLEKKARERGYIKENETVFYDVG